MSSITAEMLSGPSQNSNWRIVALLVFMGIELILPSAFIVSQILQGPPPDGVETIVRPHYFTTPLPILLHSFAGLMIAVLVPFQFAPLIRRRWPKWHRWSGRAVFLTAYLMALSAFWMLVFFPLAGGVLRTSGLAVTGAGMIVAFGLALHAIMHQHNIARHRAWMLRAIAVTYGAVGPAVILIPAYFIFGESLIIVDDLSRWVGMALNLSVVEWVLRSERPVPKLAVA